MLTQEEGKCLLKVARMAIESRLQKQSLPAHSEPYPSLREKRGVFVTLHLNGALRGCIGRITSSESLIETVSQMACEAGFNDPRFHPLRQEELPNVQLEISVLSPLRQVNDIQEIEVGRDGLLVKKGFSSGLLLPQVAREYGWTQEEFLTQTCIKAGLPGTAWQEEGVTLFTFTAGVFSEEREHV